MKLKNIGEVKDFIKATKDFLGIEITSAPTFRDGDNPHKKTKE